MKIVTWPELPWEGKRFACPKCGVVVTFDRTDLGGVGRVMPRVEVGRWVVTKQCPVCFVLRKFTEVEHGEAVQRDANS